MGSTTFYTYANGADLTTAFNAAIQDALYTYGHRSYTGTISEKDAVVVIDSTPMAKQAAEDLAERLINDRDERIADKWGPAGAIAIAACEHTQVVEIPPRPGGYPNLRAAAEAALADLPEEQSITHVAAADHHCTAQGRPCRGSLTVTIAGEPRHTGWLFFGWASC
jgi:hypothetical protein